MRAQRYIVLDFERRGPTLRGEARVSTLGRGSGPLSAKTNVEDMTPAQVARERDRGRKVVPVLPMSLVKPVSDTASERPADGDVAWGVEAVGALASPCTGKGVKVAVLDTGIDASHEAFGDLKVTQRDFTGEGDGDEDGHGTHCAGTIAGRDKDGYRFGIAQDLDELLVAKVVGQGGGATDALADAVIWAMQEGAHVISMSLGVDFPGAVRAWTEDGLAIEAATSLALQQYRENLDLFGSLAALLKANESVGRGAVVVAATGNESMRDAQDPYTIDVSPPAASDGFVRVAALSPSGVAGFSNTGASLAGPGVDIFSAAPGGGYALMSGTSMATPHVAGVAALWAEKILGSGAGGRLALRELTSRLEGGAVAPAGSERVDVGAGMVRAPE